LNRGQGFGGPVRVAWFWEPKHFALPRHGTLDKVLQKFAFAIFGPMVVTLKIMPGRAVNHVVAETCPLVGQDIAGAVPGPHAEDQQITGIGEYGFFQLV
jgi:hypothetical protein